MRFVLLFLAGFAGVSPALAASEVHDLIAGGRHPDLRWAELADVAVPLAAFYGEDGALRWSQGGAATPSAQAVVKELGAAARRGLRPRDYDHENLAKLASSSLAEPGRAARFDVGLSAALLRYLRHVTAGRIDPRRVGFNLETAREPLDLPSVVRSIASGGDVAGEIDALEPPFPLYRRLRAALARYRELAAAGEPPVVPSAASLHVGESSEITDRLRQRLRGLGDLPADAPLPADVALYDEALRAAVVGFQERHGLADDGVVGRGTLAALNVPLRARVAQIELAIERLRWLPRTLPRRFVIVNIPEFRLTAFEGDHEGAVLSSGVVVGSAARRHATPILAASMKYVVFRPYWNVPPGILREEIRPKLEEDPDYLERNDMEMRDGKVRQRPGPDNSLGLIKFIFPNPHHVYLHDTPSKELFRHRRRDFSHGCIRVAKPVELAEFVLRGQGDWTRETIVAAMQSGRDNRIERLAEPLPVFLLYSTAIAARDGEVRFFEDIYGHDAELRAALAQGPPYR